MGERRLAEEFLRLLIAAGVVMAGGPGVLVFNRCPSMELGVIGVNALGRRGKS